MARKIFYKILNDGRSSISDDEWENVLLLQNWYNSEFIWTAGKLNFKMYAVFPNLDNFRDKHTAEQIIFRRRNELKSQKLKENEIIKIMEADNLIITKKGGYYDNCLASGFTRVASNEWNAYLVCEFLLKASLLCKNAIIVVDDQGKFIKPQHIEIHNGSVIIPIIDETQRPYYESIVANRHVFSIVDPAKYDNFPRFVNVISNFNKLKKSDRLSILHNWHWLGFDNNFDHDGDDIQGFDLNQKIVRFSISI